MMFDEVRHRCAVDQPILPDAIRQLVATAAAADQEHLLALARGLARRTTLRPTAVSQSAVGEALALLLGQMIDRDTFTRRHDRALRYFHLTA
jgi:hypothetical protein